MEFTIHTPKDFKNTNWSGGTTTQLYIYPPTADYAKRNFKFRLSTAKVEAEKSDFTSLPGISRQLMILDGDLTITHQKHYSKTIILLVLFSSCNTTPNDNSNQFANSDTAIEI